MRFPYILEGHYGARNEFFGSFFFDFRVWIYLDFEVQVHFFYIFFLFCF